MSRENKGRSIGSQIMRGIYYSLFAVAFIALVIITYTLRERISAGVDLFPWGKGLGEDLMELLVKWVIMIIVAAFVYIFDSVGPCIFSKLTYFIMFIPPFLYPVIGGVGFFVEKFSQELYIKAFSLAILISYVFYVLDLIRWIIYLIRYNVKKREAIARAENKAAEENTAESEQ
ncbi:MAG: hypothetical protein J5874_05605 [Oscillospiraceae bacterium]|nr:hypothetical protein [Oscillospiraceae bacterium]